MGFGLVSVENGKAGGVNFFEKFGVVLGKMCEFLGNFGFAFVVV